METIDLLNRDDAASILLFNALSAAATDAQIEAIAKQFPEGRATSVVCVIGGVEVDVVPAFRNAVQRLLNKFDQAAADHAVKIVNGSRLKGLVGKLKDAEWSLRETLQKAFDDAGLDANCFLDYE